MPGTILVVDDSAINRQILHNLLRAEYTVLEAENGHEAITILEHRRLDISAVLLDLFMPVMDGFTVLEKIRESDILSHIPVIVLSGDTTRDTEKKALALGATDFATKPFDSYVLRRRLSNLIHLHETSALVNTLQKDRLTGVLNRDTFLQNAACEIAGKPNGYFIISCIDIENFKGINDQYGTEKGDDVLRSLARAIQEKTILHGGTCGRIAADNFLTLFPKHVVDAACIHPQWIAEQIFTETALSVILTVGRYTVVDKTLDISAMYDRAKLAQKTIKGRADRHIALYDDAMRDSILRRQEIVNDMRGALQKRQFEVWFQPQYNHATHAMIGAEALVRWRHPDKGIIPPGEFIPIFEQNGFVYSLDKYVWEETCRYLRTWLDAGCNPLPVSVNISRYDIFCPGLLDVITGLVGKYDIPVDLLRLEITESAFSKDAAVIISVVKKLIDHGFTVEIDDFGSGYSSLNTLKDVPAQILKLDLKFLESATDSQRGGNIVESVVRMAKWLGMSVIAEGVETIEQANYLRSIGCSYVQGYLYAKPMPAASYEAHCRGLDREEHLLRLETVENLDNNSFWNPASIDTLIFNSYVGAAAIFECHGGKIEALRATETFAKLFSDATTVDAVLGIDWVKHLDPECLPRFLAALAASVTTKTPVADEFVFFDLPGCPHKTYLRSTLRVIATAGDSQLVYIISENITAQRMAEKHEREAAEQMQTLMNDTPGGFARMRMHADGSGRTEYVNDGFCNMLGMTRDEVLAIYNTDLMVGVHPDDCANLSAGIGHAMATDGLLSTTYRLRAKNGDYVWVQVFARFVAAEYGDTIIHCYYADLPASEKRELALRETMPFILSAIMKSSQNLDFAKDRDFNYICCSPGFVKFTRQKTEADVIGKNDYDFWTKEEADHFRADDMRLFEGGESLINFTEPIPSDDDVQHYSVTSKYIIRDSSGEIIGLYGSGRDVTDIRSAFDRLKLLTDSIPGGIARYAISPEGIKAVYFNDGFCKMIGCTHEEYAELAKESVIRRVFPEDLPRLLAQVNALYEQGTSVNCVYRNYRVHGGGYIWINCRGEIAERSGDVCFVNAVLYDVTVQYEAEQRARETTEQLHSIMENVNCGICAVTIDKTGHVRFVSANDQYYDMLGYTRAQFAAEVTNAMDLVHPDDSDRIREAVGRVLETRQSASYTYRCTKRDGGIVHLRCNAACTDMTGVGDAVLLSVIMDITAACNAPLQQTLPLLLSAIMEASSDFVFAKDRDFRYICCSPAFLGLAGLEDMRDVVGKTDYEIFPADMAAQFRKNDLCLCESGKPLVDFDETVHTLDGTRHYCRASKNVLRDAAGAIIGIYGVSRIITKERNTLEQLQLISDNIPGGLATYIFSNNTLKIAYCNEGFCKLFGGTREGYKQRGHIDPISWVVEEDRARVFARIASFVRDNTPVDCDFRIHVMGGGVKWINMRAAATERHDDTLVFNAMLLDITERQNTLEQLRISEEENNLAVRLGGNVICRFTIADRTLSLTPEVAAAHALPETISDVPYEPVRLGVIAPASAEAYTGFFEAILRGDPTANVLFQQKYLKDWRWVEAKSLTIFSSDSKPVKAVISFCDVTDRLEKEHIYKKWLQSLENKNPGGFTLYRCNLYNAPSKNLKAGTLISFNFNISGLDFNGLATAYARQYVYDDDRDAYVAFVNSDAMVAKYYRGKRADALEYRELLPDGGTRWLRLTVELVESLNATDVEAYLMYENIDEAKRVALKTKELAETDPLTGVQNRAAFAAHVGGLLAASGPERQHAVLMLDIDGFKHVNDVFGHGVGDQTLIDVANGLRAVTRREDCVARLGGDEFIVCLCDMNDDEVVARKAQQICALARKSFSMEVQISGSVGIAMAPRHGTSFETLYKKADSALYHVKGSGKNSYAFYTESMENEHLQIERDTPRRSGKKQPDKKRVLRR